MPAVSHFRDLTTEECNALLARNHVGRIAFSFHDRIEIQPIGYVYAEGRIYVRTKAGTKLDILSHHPWVAFEVDEVTGPLDWYSVVAHGSVFQLEADGNDHDRQRYERAIELLREVIPETFTSRDPVPFRTVLLAIYVAEATGKAASTKGPPAKLS